MFAELSNISTCYPLLLHLLSLLLRCLMSGTSRQCCGSREPGPIPASNVPSWVREGRMIGPRLPVTCHVSVLSLVITTGPWPWSQTTKHVWIFPFKCSFNSERGETVSVAIKYFLQFIFLSLRTLGQPQWTKSPHCCLGLSVSIPNKNCIWELNSCRSCYWLRSFTHSSWIRDPL